jgi:hypothetical protein
MTDDDKVSTWEKIGYTVLIVGILVGTFLIYHYYSRPPVAVEPQSVEYNGYVFNHTNGIWTTNWRGRYAVYQLTFRYNPKQLEDIPLRKENTSTWNQNLGTPPHVYITFDPLGENASFSYITFAAADLTRTFVQFMRANTTVVCTRKHPDVCPTDEQIVRCDSPDDVNKSIINIDYSPDPEVVVNKNCITIRGQGEDLIRATERFLLTSIFGIMGQ